MTSFTNVAVRILYDGYIYQLQRAGGINRYFSEIISRLPDDFVPVLYGREKPSLHAPSHRRLRCVSLPHLPRFLQLADRIILPKADLLHPTYYHLTDPLKWSSLRGPVVLTVYDFVFRRYGHLYERSEKLLRAQSEAIRRADMILCISESTRADLLEFFPECARNSRVVHLAASPLPPPSEKTPHGRPYFLFVGARGFYKNFRLAVDGVNALRHRGYEVDLVVSGPPWSADERLIYAGGEFGNFVKLIEYADDAHLAALYRHAVALVYPSAYEGFGLPVLESMSLGTPVIALRQSSIPEVAGSAGLLMDAEEANPEGFVDKALRLLDDDDYCRIVSDLCLQQASRFNWERTAAQTVLAYREAVS